MAWRSGVVGAVVLSAACASTQATQMVNAVPAEPEPPEQVGGRTYVNQEFGFELTPPAGNWQLDANHEVSSEGVAVPVVLRNVDTGTQVVLQVAPKVASPMHFADRLNTGLRRQPGFFASDTEMLDTPKNAVGFHFEMGEAVQGKVAVFEAGKGRIFMMLATWPKAMGEKASGVEQILTSVRSLPRG
ncbi:MAG: hypothetical protein ACOZIN_04050 [Myxococcota bacterium]